MSSWSVERLAGQDDHDETAAFQLEEAAFNAQTNGDFEFAAEQWDAFSQRFPQHKDLAKALFNAGYCRVQLEQYGQAADRLTQALPRLGENQKKLRAQTLLYLGFSELRWADAEDAPSGEAWYRRAIEHLKTLEKDFPEFDDLDQARFFLGNALEALGEDEQAIASYRLVAGNPEATFHRDAIYYLATLLEQRRDYDAAVKEYQRVIELDSSDTLADEVRFRIGECYKQQGLDLLASGNKDQATAKLQQAIGTWQSLLGAPQKELEFRDELFFQMGVVLANLGDHSNAAEWFEKVAAMTESSRANRAATLAGREWFLAQQDDKATSVLKRAMQTAGDNAAEAAHWMAKILLHRNDFQAAFDLVTPWVERADDSAIRAPLMLDLADAAYALPDKQAQSVELYHRLATEMPDHPLAPVGLYYAAYAALEIGNLDRAIELTSDFMDKYAQNEYVPDVLEVAADAHLLKGAADRAAELFERLVREFPSHNKRDSWIVRAGLARFEKGDPAAAIEWLEPKIETITAPELKAEAWHWSGASHFQEQQFEAAANAYRRALELAPQWRRADESQLGLARSQWETGHKKEALETAREMIEKQPESPLVAEAWYRRGQWAYDQGDFQASAEAYQQVVAGFPDSFFHPHALFGLAWAKVRQDDLKGAEAAFAQLVERYKDHELAARATIARAAVLRQSGQHETAISILRTLLDDESNSVKAEDQIDARYELGLVHIARQDWPGVIQIFTALLNAAPDHPNADRFLYELGWAYRESGRHDHAKETFAKLVDQFPQSPLAAEANFHLGQYAYDAGEYEPAIEHYQACLKTASTDALREKSMYKTGWSLFRLERFDEALKMFEKQAESFAKGSLYPDALFMISESLYKKRDHQRAFEAYRVARPVIEQSTTVAPEIHTLTLLHGAQCANQAKQFDEAIAFVDEILKSDELMETRQDAWLQKGIALAGKGQPEQALEAWTQAAANHGETGVHARCLIGDHFFQQKQYDKAINQYKLAFYGYGGSAAPPDVQRWQAYAVYETARCQMVQAEAHPERRATHLAEAVKWLKYLVDHYPNDALVGEAKKQLARLSER